MTGVGPKTAAQLLGKYHTVEQVLAHADEQPAALQQKLISQKEAALLSKQLAQIDKQVPFEISLSILEIKPYDQAKLISLLQKYEFKSLLKSIQTLPQSITITATNAGTETTKTATSDCLANGGYILIDSQSQAANLANQLAQQASFAIDTETTSLNPLDAELVGVSLCWSTGQAYFIQAKYISPFLKIFTNPLIKKIGHNLKFDYQILKTSVGVELAGLTADTMLASYVLNSSSRSHSLDQLAFTEFGYQMMSYEMLVGKGKDAKPITTVPPRLLAFYAAEDADYTWRLYETFLPQLKQQQLTTVFELEVALIPVLAAMELAGVCLDQEHFASLEKRLAHDIIRLEKNIYSAAGMEFNIASPKQLKTVLFDKLKITTAGLAKTKTGVSTAASELEKMRGLHPIIDLISEYRVIAKLQSTYVTALPKQVHPKTKRLHTSYQQTIAATGRLSSTDPNLQNIPIRTPLGQEIRKGFIAAPNKLLASLDYSQIELRIMAHLANDADFITCFQRGADIHTQTAAELQGVPDAAVTKAMRRAAKSINFGIIYGMGASGLARDAGISITEARAYLDQYFALHPAIAEYVAATKTAAKKQGYVTTLFGRRRYLPEINSGIQAVRAAAERAAINHPAQGTAADIMKLAMIAVAQAITAGKITATMLLQVHDELVFEIPERLAAAEAKKIQQIMEQIYTLKVPLVVDIGVGKNWNDLEIIY